ncbi:MAG: hypothetical protein WC893_00240 [Candidatus Paceibacterota bacterium]
MTKQWKNFSHFFLSLGSPLTLERNKIIENYEDFISLILNKKNG